jgi:hypothetical protein
MPRNGNRPGEGAAHSVGSISKASENTPSLNQTQVPAGADKRRSSRLRHFLLASVSHYALVTRELAERAVANKRGRILAPNPNPRTDER